MKKLLIAIIFYAGVKILHASEPSLPIPSQARRTALIIIPPDHDICAFLITAGMTRTHIHQSLRKQFPFLSAPDQKFNVVTTSEEELPSLITLKYLQTQYPNNRTMELRIVFEK
jgi:hypothetical protein